MALRPLTALARASALAVALAGCSPSTIAEAEKKQDVAWLDQNGSPAALEALGRLADQNTKARARLDMHAAKHDIGAYIAAWNAVRRGAPWGAALLRKGLADAGGAELAAAAMTRGDPHLGAFLEDLEGALVRMGTSSRASVVSGALASIGAPARDAVERRLTEASSRGAMCRGLIGTEVAPELRGLLFSLPPSARDDSACVASVLAIAARDEAAFRWLVKDGEPGLIGAASRAGGLSCERIREMWSTLFSARPASAYPAMSVPLSEVLKRCPREVDGALGATLRATPAARTYIVNAIDPNGGALAIMPQTCAQLGVLGRGNLPPLPRRRAADAFEHGCLRGR